MGLAVPQEIALASIDDIPLAQYLTPSLTTIHVPKAEMGAHGVRMLADRVLRPGQSPVSVVLPTRLVVRDSCGAQASVKPTPVLTLPTTPSAR
jgi:DNA-binding LacI/PurR family transcriptional regulator